MGFLYSGSQIVFILIKRAKTVRINEINKRLDRLYEVIVRRDEHDHLEEARVGYLEQQVNEIRLKLAA
jgi:hypothetical protein